MARMGKKKYSVLNKQDIVRATDSLTGIRPTDRKVIREYIISNGSVSHISRKLKLSRRRIYYILVKPIVRKALKRAFRKIGIDMISITRILKYVMVRPGDFHYDFNRLKAIELYAKLTNSLAPKQIHIEGGLETTKQIKKTVINLIKVLEAEKDESYRADKQRF